jgi:hypothetical protein
MAGKKRPQSELLTWLRGQFDSHEKDRKVASREQRYASAAESQAMASAYAFTILHVERNAQRMLDTLERVVPPPDTCAYPTGCPRKRVPGLSMCKKHQPYPAR